MAHRYATAVRAHVISERPPIRIVPGDAVAVHERDTDWPAFVFVVTASGSGWVPSRHLSTDQGEATVLVAYDTQELGTAEGERVEVLERDDESGWWWCRAKDGRQGWVPVNTLGVDDEGDSET